MRQQRTNQARRRPDISNEPQYPQILWTMSVAPPTVAVLAIDGAIDDLVRSGVLALKNVRTAEFPDSQAVADGKLNLNYPSGVRWNDTFQLLEMSDVVRSKFGGRLAMGEQVSQTNYTALEWTLAGISGSNPITLDVAGIVGSLTLNSLVPFVNNSQGLTTSGVAISGTQLEVSFPASVNPGDIIELAVDSFGITDDAGNPLQNGTIIIP